MKIQFEFSAADVADTALRIAKRSKTVRDSRWYAAACWSALLSLVLYSFLDGSFIARALFTGLFFIVVFHVYSRLWRQSPSGTYLKYYQEQLGGNGPFLCEVEITQDGITTRQGGAETKRAWSAVKEIVETPDALEFAWRAGGLLVIRDRAFHTPALRSSYIQTARDLLASSSDRRPSKPPSP
jgi:YcxB-like protein